MVSVDAGKGLRPFYRATKKRPKVREIEAAEKLGSDLLEGEHGNATEPEDGEKKQARSGTATVGRKLDISL